MSFTDCRTGVAAQLCCKEGSLGKQNVHSQNTYNMINAETKTLLFVLALLEHFTGIGYYILTIHENKVAISSGYFQKQVSL